MHRIWLAFFSFPKSVVSHAIAKLEYVNYIKREIHPSDKRRYVFKMTAKGKRILPALMEGFDNLDSDIENMLSKADKTNLDLLLSKIQGH